MSLFGTDGIRGRAGTHPMTAEIALEVGTAAGTYFNRGTHRHKAIIAKDTRLSGYMLEPALTAGLTSTGMDVVLVGPLPTPAVAMLVSSMRADLGIMISASHNPYFDNGIKLFGPDGFKLSEDAETEIEALITSRTRTGIVDADKLGRATRLENARGRYIELAKSTFPKELTLEGMNIVLDCAHGAAYQVGPLILSELGAKVVAIGTTPNGYNINHECGSTSPDMLSAKVLETRADIGIALDGDGDRVIICDEHGEILDGDQLMAIIATHLFSKSKLNHNTIVTTHMSNLGLEHYLEQSGMQCVRTKIGDRYVMETMREKGCNLGGEQSGHIILSDYTTTGDGLIAALQILAVIAEKNLPLSCLRLFTPMPQILVNVPYKGDSPLEKPQIKSLIKDKEQQLSSKGRLLIRPSGTEPVIRVMVEGEDREYIRTLANEISSAIKE